MNYTETFTNETFAGSDEQQNAQEQLSRLARIRAGLREIGSRPEVKAAALSFIKRTGEAALVGAGVIHENSNRLHVTGTVNAVRNPQDAFRGAMDGVRSALPGATQDAALEFARARVAQANPAAAAETMANGAH